MCTAVDPSVMASRSPNRSYIAPTSAGDGTVEVPSESAEFGVVGVVGFGVVVGFVVGFVAKVVSSGRCGPQGPA
ncbi:hypothetical protein GCM10010349_20810 [Streptomyces flavofungini]|nr:hypothetical protein GCM10010349_20810 [Streptomyces flavofungini]